jgi:hypothetical protein
MPLASRRSAPRSGIAGKPGGTLDALEPLSVRALSPDGMLIESPNPLEVGSIHEFQLMDGTSSVRVRAAVKHVSPLRQSSDGRYFLVDLEFLNLNSRSSAAVERWLNGRSARSTHREA